MQSSVVAQNSSNVHDEKAVALAAFNDRLFFFFLRIKTDSETSRLKPREAWSDAKFPFP